MSIPERLYRSLVRAARPAASLLARGDAKLARSIRGRRGVADRFVRWSLSHRDPERPLLWIHAPSVGEGLQARAVLEAVRARWPEVQSVFTHFSASAEPLAARMPADLVGYLPWDVAGEAGRAAAALAPDLLVFTKTELWPVLASAARRRGGRTALVAATLSPGSSRLRWPSRAVLRPTLAALDLVAAIGAEDAERMIEAGAAPEAVRVTGDPGIDSAVGRAAAADPMSPHLRPFAGMPRPTVVAGSTWPADDAVLVPAALAARRREPSLRLVVAPHEPEEAGMRAIERRLGEEGWRTVRLGAVEAAGTVGEADLVVVDRVGVLADLYTVADVAWVGGGFHRSGLHSVLEPAAAGVPVLFGPRHANARAAGALAAEGGAREVRTVAEASDALLEWLSNPAARGSAGAAARRYIDGHLGAADRTADLLGPLLGRD